MLTKIITFNAKDDIILNGIIYKNNKKTNKIIIQVHGMTSNCFKKRNQIIANTITDISVDTFDFNNRGSDVIRYISDGKSKKLAGTAYENIEECYYDIVGAIEYVLSLGYEDIYLQGHSLGSTKVVYTYNRLLKEHSNLIDKIKGIILLSLVDITGIIKQSPIYKCMKIAEEKEKNKEIMEMMPIESFIHPMSVKNYLMYTKYNSQFDFAKYDEKDNKFEVLNNIRCPLFMRWGNVNEMIIQDASDLSNLLNKKIKNKVKDISYIDGANHGYHGKEQILADEIKAFLTKILY